MSDRDLFANFERMRREMDELFGDVFERTRMGRRRAAFTPATDVAYTAEPPTAIVTMELAGVPADTVDIQLQGRQLVITGARDPSGVPGANYQQVEIERGGFRRAITLAADPRPDQVRATHEDGMLKIEIPLQVRRPAKRSVPIESER